MEIPYLHPLILSAAIFTIGVLGFLTRKNLIIILLSLELMLNGAGLSFVTFSRYWGEPHGQIFTIFIMALTAAEVSIGIALLILIYRDRKTVDVDRYTLLRD
jgi:NADH-quinone oxidoreductase subunit K